MKRLIKADLIRFISVKKILIFILFFALYTAYAINTLSTYNLQSNDMDSDLSQAYLDRYYEAYLSLDGSLDLLEEALIENSNSNFQINIDEIEYEKQVLMVMIGHMSKLVAYQSNTEKYFNEIIQTMIDMDTYVYENLFLEDRPVVYSRSIYRDTIEDLYPRLIKHKAYKGLQVQYVDRAGFNSVLQISTEYVFWITFIFFLAISNYDMWSVEYDKGAIKNLFTQPYKKKSIYISRLGVRISVSVIVLLVLVYGPPTIAHVLNGPDPIQVNLYSPHVLGNFFISQLDRPLFFSLKAMDVVSYSYYILIVGLFYTIFFLSFVSLISVLTRDSFASAIGVGIGLTLSFFKHKYNPFSYINVYDLLIGNLGLGLIGVILITSVLSLVLLGLGYKLFKEYEV